MSATVVLVHGLWTTRHVMFLLAARLRLAGYATTGWSYAAMRDDLDQNAALLARRAAAVGATSLHYVAHSYGGLVLLRSLALRPDPRVRRIVLLGSPVGGSSAGADLAGRAHWRPVLGATARVWAEPPRLVIPPGVEAGAIAGTRSVGLGRLVARFPDPNDGVVRTDETRIAGLTDHLVMDVGHSMMLASSRVARQVGAFLADGRFAR